MTEFTFSSYLSMGLSFSISAFQHEQKQIQN